MHWRKLTTADLAGAATLIAKEIVRALNFVCNSGTAGMEHPSGSRSPFVGNHTVCDDRGKSQIAFHAQLNRRVRRSELLWKLI